MLLKILIKSKLLRMGAPVTALKLWCRFDRAGIWIEFWSAVKAVSELGAKSSPDLPIFDAGFIWNSGWPSTIHAAGTEAEA
jgi:hypothetical protein